MSLPIARLPEILINQIAAGEVVERPANVIKELVENSLDAGSTRIDVQLEDGGISAIAILDNGAGIEASELELALERHTTSKIRRLEDLESIGSYGFRGEALSSIASVSEFEIRSRTAQNESGALIRAAFGKIVEGPRSAPCAVGTAMRVSGLFSQVPARAKFLRSGATEFSHCSRILKELALGNAPVVFSLTHHGKQVYVFTSQTREQRVREVLRVDWKPLEIRETRDEMILEAFLSPPSLIQDRAELFLYINGRSVRNQNLKSAVRSAYLDTLGPHHEPSGAVFLDLRRDWIDVNVHPQKLEVRLLRQEQIYQWLLVSLRKQLQAAPRAASPLTKPASLSVRPAPLVAEPRRSWETSRPPLSSESELNWTRPVVPPKAPALRYLGQLHATYLLCEDRAGLVFIDQQALQEKQAWEKLERSRMAGQIRSRKLALPRIVRLSSENLERLEKHQTLFQTQGFEVEPFGDGDVSISLIPELLSEDQAETAIQLSLQALDSSPDPSRAILATIAKLAAAHPGSALSFSDASALLADLDRPDAEWVSPDGRPVIFRLPLHQIRKHFERP